MTLLLRSRALALPLLIAIAALFECLAPRATHASEGFIKIVRTHPMSRRSSGALSCFDAFSSTAPFRVVESKTEFKGDQLGGDQQTQSTATERPESTLEIVRRVLKSWVESRDFTEEQARLLEERDRALDPRRTTYVHLSTDGHSAMIRVFDGSTRVRFGGEEWTEASATSPLTPIELTNPHYELPERRTERANPNRPAYLWELGLLNVDRQLPTGVDAALRNVAVQLDMHYNDQEFGFFKKTESIEQKRMMIYAQTRPNRVELFKKYGFKPVIAVDAKGQAAPFEVSPNLILMYMKAEDFLRLYGGRRQFASSRQGRAPIDETENEANFRKNQEYFAKLEARRVPIRNRGDLVREFSATFQLYVAARTLTGFSPERQKAIIAFFESYIPLVNSIPESIRHQNWGNLRAMIRDCLSGGTAWEAFYYFAESMDHIGDNSPRAYSPEGEAKFYSTRPTKFLLIAPANPVELGAWPVPYGPAWENLR